MTALEIFLSIILWIIIGLWISYKRNWYQDCEDLEFDPRDPLTFVFLNVLASPLAFVISLFKEYINKKWD